MSLVKIAVAGCAGILLGFALTRYSNEPPPIPDTSLLEQRIVELQKNLFGYTSYETYLSAAKTSINAQAKLITGKVVRQERAAVAFDKSILGQKFRAVVEVSYQAEYNFGFDLSPNRYNIRNAKNGNGIEIVVRKPTLLTTPGTNRYGYRVLSDDFIVDGNKVLNKTFQQIPIWARENGTRMADTPEVRALCEKALIDFVKGFLQKQPNVKSVPQIAVVYYK